jgi:N-acetylglutamate synthase-like GNAT family acetyltransferase/predicted RNA methylase
MSEVSQNYDNKAITESGLSNEEIVDRCIKLNYRYLKLGLMGPMYGAKNGLRTSLKDGRLLYSVSEDKKFIGFLLWNILKRTNTIDIRKVAIEEDFKYQGFGKKLYEQVVNICKEKNINFIRAKASNLNTDSHKWYTGLGFIKVDEGDNTVTFIKELNGKKYEPIVKKDNSVKPVKLEWVIGEEAPKEFEDIVNFFDEEERKNDNGEVTPWIFKNDLTLFKKQYDRLCRGTILPTNRHIACLDLMEFYHKQMWFMNGMASILEWQNNKKHIINNRLKYVDLQPRALRRYFRICYMVPNLFQDNVARYMSSEIVGNLIYDPFAGFGGRMLGVSSMGKQYIGNDINALSVNANNQIIRDIGLKNVEVLWRDSRNFEIECDGLITSPPFYNKDVYKEDSEFKSLDDFKTFIHDIFCKVKVRDKAIIDFKENKHCSLDDFESALPFKNIERKQHNFNGMKNHGSIHTWFYCS